MSKYVTVAAAAKTLKVSPKTIRRRLDKMSTYLSKYVQRDGQRILIDERLVLSNFQPFEDTEKAENKQKVTEKKKLSETGEKQAKTGEKRAEKLLPVIQNQLAEKDKQISKLQNTIESLTERNRELNILIGSMQKEREKILIETAKDTHPTTEPQPIGQNPTRTQGIIIVLLWLILLAVVLLWLDIV